MLQGLRSLEIGKAIIGGFMSQAEQPPLVSPNPRGWKVQSLIVFCIAAAFCPVLSNNWIGYDDPANVTENPYFFPVTWRGLARFWAEPYYSLYIPLSYSLFAAESALSRFLDGEGPLGPIQPTVFHAVSIGLHAATAVIVARILRHTGASPLAAGIGALVFGLHPLQVESVAWISEQRGLLAAFLSLLATDLVLQSWATDKGSPRKHQTVWIAFVAYGVALLAKPSVVTVPMMAIVLGSMNRRGKWRSLVWSLLPWFGAAAVAVVVNRFAQSTDLNRFSVPLLLRPVVAADSLAFYAEKLVWPVNLCIMYGRTPDLVLHDRLLPIRVVMVAACGMAVAGFALLRPVRRPSMLFVIGLLPVLGLVSFVFQNQSGVADRYAYLAMLGPALGVAIAIDAISRNGHYRRFAFAVVGLVLLAWGVLSARQTFVWRNTATVSEHACAVAPAAAPSWVMLSGHHLLAGDPGQAARCAMHALQLAPLHRIALFNLLGAAARLQDQKTVDEAIRQLKAGGLASTEIADVFFLRGSKYLADGQAAEAAIDLATVLDIRSDHKEAATTLAVALAQLGYHDAAERVMNGAERSPGTPPASPTPSLQTHPAQE